MPADTPIETDIADLFEFYERWPMLRSTIVHLTIDPTISPQDQEILNWMVLLVDRIGKADIGANHTMSPPPQQGYIPEHEMIAS
ncbi:hypothetical protein [Cochlodiniinecator piscidefendens]|uniref:hypothetical protein n=1 Tax=Cochlodiniinecator piscidefendens TaxID=2715756 RepID=UPI001407CC40|nr:hypothetical protein [Cochlodiniinecator piscidefendens]